MKSRRSNLRKQEKRQCKNVFQAAHIVIASRAKSTAWQSPETIFKRAASEFKNCFRVAYPKKTAMQKVFSGSLKIISAVMVGWEAHPCIIKTYPLTLFVRY